MERDGFEPVHPRFVGVFGRWHRVVGLAFHLSALNFRVSDCRSRACSLLVLGFWLAPLPTQFLITESFFYHLRVPKVLRTPMALYRPQGPFAPRSAAPR